MKKTPLIVIFFVLLTTLGLGMLYQTVPPEGEVHEVVMIGADGSDMGVIRMSETKAGVLLTMELSGLTPNGEHAIHVHEVGQCDPPFTSAGGHYNPTDHAHGLKHPKGHHAGDMPNLEPDEKGQISTQILNRKITLEKNSTDDRASVFDADGSSIIIHAGADDHMSQPSGAAGGRIACGLIE